MNPPKRPMVRSCAIEGNCERWARDSAPHEPHALAAVVDFLDKQFVLPRKLFTHVEQHEPPFGKAEAIEVVRQPVERS